MKQIVKISLQPSYVGSWTIGGNGGLSINLAKKPNWIHRKMTILLLGWVWRDNN